MSELLKEAKRHYEQLAPHVKSRETAKVLKALIDALDNQWQPIETSPENEVIMLFATDCIYIGYRENESDYDENPTHWRPLPQPPKQ